MVPGRSPGTDWPCTGNERQGGMVGNPKPILSAEDVFLPETPPPKSRAGRIILWCLLIGICGVVLLEVSAAYFHARSISQVRELGTSRAAGSALRRNDVEGVLAGRPGIRESRLHRAPMVIYTWPSLFRTYRLRSLLKDNGDILYVDNETAEDEDFGAPFLTQQADGIKVHDYAAPVVAPNVPTNPALPPSNFTTKDPMVEIEKYFAEPALSLAPGVIVFPLADEKSAILPGGPAVSMVAQFSITYTPRKRLALDPRQARRTLVECDCWKEERTLNAERVALCLAAANTSRSILPRLVTEDGKRRLIVEFRAGSFGKDHTFTHDLIDETLRDLPPLIALDTLEAIHETLSDDDRKWIVTRQFAEDDDAVSFSRFASFSRSDPKALQKFYDEHLAGKNPDWVAGWDLLTDEHSDKWSGIGYLPKTQVSECGPIARTRLKGNATPHLAVSDLAVLAPSQRQEPLFYHDLIEKAVETGRKDLIDRLYSLWEQNDTSYAGRVERGRLLLDSGWRARGSGWAKDVSDEGWDNLEGRAQKAQRELEQALAQNPSGCAAHSLLIGVAHARGLPFEFVQEHFLAATKVVNGYYPAWNAKRNYLQKRWYGTDQRIYSFIDDCLASEAWNEGIPQMTPGMLRDMVIDPRSNLADYRRLHSPEYWKRAKAYGRGSMARPYPEQRRFGLNYLAMNAVYSGHLAEAVELFQELDKEQVEAPSEEWKRPVVKTEYDSDVFGPPYRYAMLRDFVLAHAGQGIESTLAATRAALAGDQLDEAARLLESAGPADETQAAELKRLNHALQLGRRLRSERRVKLTPEECRQVFAQVRRLSWRSVDHDDLSKVDDDKLLFTHPNYDPVLSWQKDTWLFFPVGLRHARISGVMEWDELRNTYELHAHSQALRSHVTFKYYPLQPIIDQVVSSQVSRRERLPPGPVRFVLEYSSDVDRLSPASGVVMEIPVLDDVPSTFGFSASGLAETNAPLKLSGLTIELLD